MNTDENPIEAEIEIRDPDGKAKTIRKWKNPKTSAQRRETAQYEKIRAQGGMPSVDPGEPVNSQCAPEWGALEADADRVIAEQRDIVQPQEPQAVSGEQRHRKGRRHRQHLKSLRPWGKPSTPPPTVN